MDSVLIKMASTQEEENFWRMCQIVLNIIPKNLRIYFKLQWDSKYPQNKWQDSASDGQFLIGQIRQQALARFKHFRQTLNAGDSNKWDPSALFFVFNNVGIVNKNERSQLDKLREIRNDCFHSKSASMTPQDLLMKITDIQSAFTFLNLQSGLVEITTIQNAPIETQLSSQLKVQLDQERQLNDHQSKYIADQLNEIEETISEGKRKHAATEEVVEGIEKRLKVVEEKEPQPSHFNVNIYGEIVILEDGETTDEEDVCEPSIDLAPELKDESLRLKEHYKEIYSKHTITIVSEDGKRICREERDIGDFAVEVREQMRTAICSDMKNERIEFINKMRYNRYRSKAVLSDLLYENGINFIRGVAGSGKTVLSKQIALQWANNEIFTDFNYLFFIESKDLSDSKLNLEDFMKECSFPTPEEMDAKDVLFIIDGLDEIEDLQDQLRDVKSTLSQLLGISSYTFRESKFILTGRPHVERTLQEAVRKISVKISLKVFEMCGLSEDSIDGYITMFAKEDPTKIEQIKKTRDSSQNIESTLSLPQHLNTLCCMSLMTGGMAIRNFTELCTWLLFIFLKDHVNGDSDEDMSQEEIFRKFATLIIKLAEVAFKLFENKKITFAQEEFDSILKEIEKDDVMAKGFRVFCCDQNDRCELQQKFRFLHLTMQEYLASVFCYVNKIALGDFIKNNDFEVLNFLSGLHGCTLKNQPENEESLINIFVCECLKSTEEQEEQGRLFMLSVLDALRDSKADVEHNRLQRGLTCLSEYLSSRFKYTDKGHLDEVISKLISIPKNFDGLNIFTCCSSISQLNLHSLMEIAAKNNLSEKFRNVYLSFYPLSYFPLCKYFSYFGLVDLRVCDKQPAAELKLLFSACLDCTNVEFRKCTISGDCFDSNGCQEDLDGVVDKPRVKRLCMVYCEIDEIGWKNIIRLIPKIEKVEFMGIIMKMKQWKELVDIIQKRDGDSRLKEMVFRLCKIDGYLIEMIKEAGLKIDYRP